MPSPSHIFFSLIEKNIHFEYVGGASSRVGYPHTTGWRVLPFLMVAQINYAGLVELKGERPTKARPGEAVIVSPGQLHNLTKQAPGVGCSRWAHIQCEIFPGISLFHLVRPPLIVKGIRARKIGRICQDLGKISTGEPSLSRLLHKQALGWALISTLLGSITLQEDHLALIRHATRLSPVLAYIEEHLAEPIRHDLLARTASLSPSRFHFLFRSALGAAPYEYVQKLRLRKAQQLLIRTDKPVSEIGREVGHPDPFHFSRIFRRNLGMSPMKYRQQMALPSF
jgi:AraC-like DNA-binding protein